MAVLPEPLVLAKSASYPMAVFWEPLGVEATILVNPPPLPAKTELVMKALVMKALVMARPLTTLVARAASPPADPPPPAVPVPSCPLALITTGKSVPEGLTP